MINTSRFFVVLTVLWQLGSTPALASQSLYGDLAKETMISFGPSAPEKPLPLNTLRLFIWNIHKGTDPRLVQDFEELSNGAHLVLFQEAVSAPAFTLKLLNANPSLEWTMAKAFRQWDDSYTGVATGSTVKPLGQDVIISEAKEPVIKTPKTILLSYFSLENSKEELLVANIHGINFVSLKDYKTQIHQLLEKIQGHQGPLIVAGDFNTWDPARWIFLQKALKPLGLQVVTTPESFMNLDHIFVRNLRAKLVFDLSDIDSSDHAPLLVDLTYDRNATSNSGVHREIH